MTDKRKLRVFCPTHEAAFEVAESPKILCEITDHALSIDFPNAEFWEFCCNCETFAPSKLDKGEKARKSCYNCGNTISKRFACASCKTFSFECDTQAKGKRYFINAQKGIEPNCPGCQTANQNGALVRHECKDIDVDFFTARETCPFCAEKTSTPVADARREAAPNAGFQNASQTCPQCRAENPSGAPFCGKCGHQLRNDVVVENRGDDVNKTKLLGSLCPNCSTPIPPDSGFCGECGQAVKSSVAPPPPPPPKRSEIGNIPPTFNRAPAVENSASSLKSGNTPVIIGGVAVGFLLLVVIGSVISSSKSNSTSSNTTSGSMSNGYAKNAYTPASSDSRIGRTGKLTTNARIRIASNKNSQILGVHYQGAKIQILDVDSYATNEGATTWYQVKILENGCDAEGKNGCGNDNPNASDGFGWMEAADEGWINSKTIDLR